MATRSITYDDQDTNIIQYSGQWFVNTSALESFGNYGTPYLDTLHGTNHNASVSFEFDGTGVEVYGSNVIISLPDATGTDPNLECFVDGVSIGREPISEPVENNWKLCGKGGLSAGPHKLELDITVQSPNHTFWLDQIRYTPSPSVSLENKTMAVINNDPAIRLDNSWHSLAYFNVTSETNATAQIDFIGTSVAWVGCIPVELPHGSASGTYSIDDGDPVSFNLAGLDEDAGKSMYNQSFFTTPVVENGHHTLTVTFLGTKYTTPLTLDYLYITNGTRAASSNGSTAINSDTAGTTGDRGKSGLSVGPLLGGILGGLALIIITAGAFLYRRHRRLSQYNMLRRFTGKLSPPMPFNYYSHSSIGPRAVPYERQPSSGNQTSAKQRETLRLETRPTKQSRGESEGAESQSATGDGFGRVHTDSGIRLNEPVPVEDIPPRYTLD